MRNDLLGTLGGWRARYGDVVRVEVNGTPNYNFFHPEHIHQILVEQAASFHKTPDYTDEKLGLARFLGNGLLVSDGEFWKRQRKLVAPALHTRRIENYAETMVNFTLRALEDWQDGQTRDLSGDISRLTMTIVAKTLFDADVRDDVARVGHTIDVLQQSLGTFNIMPAWVPTPGKARSTHAARDLDEIVYRIIAARRQTPDDRGDLLSMLLLAVDEEASGMTDKQARDELVTLFLAGHETTANNLKWTWILLSQHPEVEAKLHEELDSVLAGRAPTLADLPNLPYTEWVIKESMRLYPTAYAFSRLAMQDVRIGEYDVPRGSMVHILSYETQRDSRWFAEPLRFWPERFANQAEKSWPRYAYFPFGGGPRICIGNSFALMEARLLLATIAGRYRLRLAPGQRVAPRPLVTLVPKYGLWMVVEARR
jgi:cytochrome P450